MKTIHGPAIEPIESESSIVISGIAGKYPRSDNVQEFADNLYSKEQLRANPTWSTTTTPSQIDLVDEKEDRWRHTHPDIPKRLGKLNTLAKFDADFFGYSPKEAHTMDPQHRILLEHCYEAVLDAGLHLDDLRGSRTGVFIGFSMSETETYWTYKKTRMPYKKVMLGFTRSMLALKIAYALDLKGPAVTVDTACSSSMYALDWACKAIRQGQCEAAFVAGTNLTLHPYITLQFALLGVLAADGYCRPFDKQASGYSRSEANAVILLQKAKDSKRIYAHVVNTKTNCDGYKLEGITFPSNKIQKQLLDELYAEVPYDPKDVSYVEAHSTGTVVGDPEECDAIEKVFCPDRNGPLLVGSVKSNIGHSEPAAGICSITKCIIAIQTNLIPPNIHYTEPRKDVPSLLNGHLKVVDVATPLDGPLVAVNSFGFGGANAHALLHAHTRKKVSNGRPSDDLPRLVVWSGRTIEAVDHLLEGVAKHNFDPELYALTHNIQRKELTKMNNRGYAILARRDDGTAVVMQKSVAKARKALPKFAIVFAQMDYDWQTTLRAFEKFPPFKSSVEQCLGLLKAPEYECIFSKDQHATILQRAVWTLIIQISVYHTLKAIGLQVDQYGGYSIGQITCAYIDGVLSLSDAIRVAFTHGVLLGSYHNPETFNYRDIITDKDLNAKLASVLQSFLFATPTKKWKTATSVLSFRIYDPKSSAQIFNRIDSDAVVLQPLPSIQSTDNIVKSFLATIGRAFVEGQHCRLLDLYPEVKFPVSLETPMIGPLIQWDHSIDWHVANFQTKKMVDQGSNQYTVTLAEQEYIAGHCIDGRVLIPATEYLICKTGTIPNEVAVEFTEVEFLRATTITSGQTVTLFVEINDISGHFEVTEGSTLVVKGYIQRLNNFKLHSIQQRNTQAVTLPTKDFYKELRLRGYHYGGFFKSVLEAAADGSCANIEWKGNWTALLDCMLQIAIIAVDSRSLVIPTRIESIKIDPIQQKSSLQASDENVPFYSVCFDRDLNLLQSSGIEIRGLNASTIARRLPPGVPVLESYKFYPYCSRQTIQPAQAASIILQTILDNQTTLVCAVTEIHSKTKDPIITLFGDAIGDLPLVKAHLTLLSSAKPEPIPNVTISEEKLMKQRNVLLLICENLFNDDEFISDAINSLSDQGFILLRESEGYQLQDSHRRLQLVSTIPIEGETFLLLQQKKSAMNTSVDAHVIKISSNDTALNWLLELKQENDPSSGIIGLVNCIRKEPNIQTVSCFFIDDPNAPAFDPSNPFYKDQIELGLAINVYRNGQWGCYRHFKLHEEPRYESTTNHCFANCVKPGDLSSFTWMVGPLSEQPPTSPLVKVVYSSLNFKDVMLATGRLTVETFCTDRLQQECVLGFEYSGVTATGKRCSCGRGNAGQSNYGMANSIMERIIEHRVAQGLPGKAIQWGAIGEVGIVADMQEDKIDMEIGGTLQQRLSSCIQVLDQLLTTAEPVVASMVVAEKRSSSGGAKNIVEAVMNIMNIRDMKSVSVESTLADIGMDSLMAVEIRQVLERDFDIILTPQDLRTLTFSKLQKLADAKAENEAVEAATQQLQLEDLLASFGDEAASHHTVLRLPSKCNDLEYDRPVLIIPGIESVCSPAWTKIASEINAPTFMLQTFARATDEQTIAGIVDTVFDEMFETVFAKVEQFLVIGYSFGSLLALEIVKRLEARSLQGKLMLIDGSPLYLQRFASHHLSGFDDEHLQMAILTLVLSIVLPTATQDIIKPIMDRSTYLERVDTLMEVARDSNPFSEEYARKMMRVLFYRLKAAMNMSTEAKEKIVSPLVLVRSAKIGDVEEDYGLSEFTVASLIVKIIDGTHQTMLENPELIEIINKDTL
uniref:Fatty acid synthase n=1 Tax=Anopheles stephensi TaxID=30069 RepID=A0A182Y5H6_ANOST